MIAEGKDHYNAILSDDKIKISLKNAGDIIDSLYKETNIKLRKINNKKLLEKIGKRIRKVNGDFRQKEIIHIWKKELKTEETFFIASFKVKCSSGTYVRGIAQDLGEKMGLPALAYTIKRTKIGKYDNV
jgi:tRNA U55 pseudouridine synthase TruB